MKKTDTLTFVRIAMIAAVYTVVSLALAPISYGNIQVRIAEALTILPLLYKPSIYGVTLGCFLTNLLGAFMGVNPTGFIDAIIGTLATFLAAECTYMLKDKTVKSFPLWSVLMPVIFNFFFVGAELAVLYFEGNVVLGTLIMGSEVAVGELISVILGWLLLKPLGKTNLFK
ncbi:MAG: QueT transporter family protein [Bulleidia sp.]|nr:QueT transporter family protein [Bulleidia sp.]